MTTKKKENLNGRYYLTTLKDVDERPEYDVEQVEKPTVIQTPQGEALITPPNYVATGDDGEVFGIAEADLKGIYTKVSSKSKTKE